MYFCMQGPIKIFALYCIGVMIHQTTIWLESQDLGPDSIKIMMKYVYTKFNNKTSSAILHYENYHNFNVLLKCLNVLV